MVYTQTGAVASGTGTIPLDDTIPQSGEGTQFLTKAITPKSATNILRIDTTLNLYFNGSAVHMVIALFQDSTADALAAGVGYISTSGADTILNITHHMVAGTASATTFKVRAGAASAGTTVLNGSAGPARWLGGVAASSITITEYKV